MHVLGGFARCFSALHVDAFCPAGSKSVTLEASKSVLAAVCDQLGMQGTGRLTEDVGHEELSHDLYTRIRCFGQLAFYCFAVTDLPYVQLQLCHIFLCIVCNDCIPVVNKSVIQS